ncbi:hypothetical protein D1632_12075 [Chryseobacterium nematophagum]|uniref:Uncharacterized protein n=1 Tax=Chryseobacterium nematophagum TaxID=2305228 RepID=A0A3M7L6K6_9FLAO|nr:hypothetical protein [Chryseobacterium nematophagum]RMZ58358.1 hypothetical protein D1632_12075 [Chryseobacterium nematophagum]
MIKEVVFKALNWRWYFTSFIALFFGIFCWLMILILPRSSFVWNFFSFLPFVVAGISFILGISRLFKKDQFKNGLWQCFLSVVVLFIIGILFTFCPPKSPYKPYKNDIVNPKNAAFSMPLKIAPNGEKQLVEVVSPNIILYDYLQPGNYKYDVFLNKIEKGKVYLKVYDFNTNRILSEKEVKKKSQIEVFNSTNELKEFGLDKNFTIEEGDWGDYYGSKIEVWFQPEDTTKLERRLFTKNYIIQGN